MNTINTTAPVHYSSNTTTDNLLIKSMLTLTKKLISFSKKAFSELEKLGEGAAYAIQR
jgi:hypothetical protein